MNDDASPTDNDTRSYAGVTVVTTCTPCHYRRDEDHPPCQRVYISEGLEELRGGWEQGMWRALDIILMKSCTCWCNDALSAEERAFKQWGLAARKVHIDALVAGEEKCTDSPGPARNGLRYSLWGF